MSFNRFEVVEEIPWNTLQDQVRRVTLLNQPDEYIYANSTIRKEHIPLQNFSDIGEGELSVFHKAHIAPTAKYVLADNLELQAELRDDLLNQIQRDQTHLAGGVVLFDHQEQQRRSLVPPIIERTQDEGSYVLDGAHRVWGARTHWNDEMGYDWRLRLSHEEAGISDRDWDYMWDSGANLAKIASRVITAIVVENPAYPAYARPNAWRDIHVVNQVPSDPADKKDYRTEWPGGYTQLYRDYGILGSAGLRGI